MVERNGEGLHASKFLLLTSGPKMGAWWRFSRGRESEGGKETQRQRGLERPEKTALHLDSTVGGGL